MDAGPARFRTVGPADAALVAALHQACFAEPWSSAAVRTLMAVPATWGVLAYLDGEAGPDPVGYCLARGATEHAEILSFGVVPGFRRHGFGQALVHEVARQARGRGAARILLEVADDNEAGRGLYSDAGFVRVGGRPNYYRRPRNGRVDAVVMSLDLATYTLTEERK